jgi:putative copper export protein
VSDLPLYLHLVGAAIWLGGLLWLAFSTVIAARSLPREQFRTLVRRSGRAFAILSIAAWALIGATGLGFAFQRGWPGLVVLKAILGAAVVIAAAAHVVTGMRTGSRAAIAASRALSGLIFAATLGLFWIGVRIAA